MSLERLQQRISYPFRQAELLAQALTHRSFGNLHNERLEFLGDSVLNLVIADELYGRFAHLKEGELSRLRAQLVRQEALHGVARSIDLGAFLRLGEGELRSGGIARPSILADALEALFGAVFIDGGFEEARSLIRRLYQPLLDDLDNGSPEKDAKTLLQEFLQARRLSLPRYAVTSTVGAAHSQQFEVECIIPDLPVRATGRGMSRRAAEQEAAMQAFKMLRR